MRATLVGNRRAAEVIDGRQDGRQNEEIPTFDERFRRLVELGLDDHVFQAVGKRARLERRLKGAVDIRI